VEGSIPSLILGSNMEFALLGLGKLQNLSQKSQLLAKI
jgi:hypothetical protein